MISAAHRNLPEDGALMNKVLDYMAQPEYNMVNLLVFGLRAVFWEFKACFLCVSFVFTLLYNILQLIYCDIGDLKWLKRFELKWLKIQSNKWYFADIFLLIQKIKTKQNETNNSFS